jgi:hypothetical protein
MAADFPGFARLSTLASLLVKTAGAHGNILNTAWGGILQGNYGHRELLRDTAKFYQSHFDLIDSLLPNAQASLPNIPSWLTLNATKNPTIQALSGTVEIREFNATNGNLEKTPLAAFSGLDVHFKFDVNQQDATRLGVQVTSFVASDGKSTDLRQDTAAIAEVARNYPGTYLGLIYDQRAGTSAPLAVVILLI